MGRLGTMVCTVVCAALAAGVSGQEWKQYAVPETAGWSESGLEEAHARAVATGSAAVLVVENGTVVAAWGEIDRSFPLYSMRKGLYNALVGKLVESGDLNLDTTIESLGIDDLGVLSEIEKSATIEDLLVSRSGVYHESAYEPASMKRNRPERGSHRPGEQWFYNNWDFNLVAHLIAAKGERVVAEQFRDAVAKPLGMQDFDVDHTFEFLEPSRSSYPAILFRMSARDLARFGQLYLQGGEWEGERLLPRDWIDRSWTPHVRFRAEEWPGESGFGYLWWIYLRGDTPERPLAAHDLFLTRGSGGQVLAVIPSLELVVVHLTDSGNAGETGFDGALDVIEAIVEARLDERQGESDRIALRVRPLGATRPAPERHEAVEWPAGLFEELQGTYALGPRIRIEVHPFGGRLFALPKGAPLAEVELFVDADGRIFSPAVDLLVESVREDGELVALVGRMDGRTVRIEKTATAE